MKKFILMIGTATVLSTGLASESRAEDSYVYDDNGRISDITVTSNSLGTPYTSVIHLRYNDNNEIIGGTVSGGRDGGSNREISVTDNIKEDGSKDGYLISTGYIDYGAIIDSSGKIRMDGAYSSSSFSQPFHRPTVYTYDETTGEKISRTLYNCEYGSAPLSNCTQSATQYYSYEYDEDGNIIAEKINGEVVATRTYSPVYLAKLKAAQTCPAGTFSVGGECLPKRYTPAELAEIVGESNTILLYYK